MAGSRVGLFDNLNIPIHRDAQHREDREPDANTRVARGVRVWHPSTTPRGIDFRVHLKLEPSCRPTRRGFRAFRKSHLWRAR